jgi:hypothetical protein
MHVLTAAELLEVWETGQDHDPAHRALLVLAAATGAPVADLLAVSIPRRDTLLFDVRRATFGDQLRAIVSCPACGESLEFTTTVTAVVPAESPPADSVTIETNTLRASIRPPTTVDLLAIRDARSIETARDELLGRCIESLERDGTPVPLASLSADEIAALAAAASDDAALVDLVLDLTCAACGAAWQSTFDVAAFFWEEVRAFASRLLPEVHRIARAYGWSERDILALSPSRRARYLELIEAGV